MADWESLKPTIIFSMQDLNFPIYKARISI